MARYITLVTVSEVESKNHSLAVSPPILISSGLSELFDLFLTLLWSISFSGNYFVNPCIMEATLTDKSTLCWLTVKLQKFSTFVSIVTSLNGITNKQAFCFQMFPNSTIILTKKDCICWTTWSDSRLFVPPVGIKLMLNLPQNSLTTCSGHFQVMVKNWELLWTVEGLNWFAHE